MARGRRKVNTDTLDAKIEQQKAALEKAKAKYEAEKETLAELIKLRNEHYAFPEYRQTPGFSRYVANRIYTPSYIRSGSFESWGSSGIHYDMSAVNIDVVCNAENVMSVCYDLAINGESERTGGVENADKSAFKKGELLYFEFTEQMIGNQVATGETFELTLTFSVIDTDGKVHEIDGEYTREMMLGASLSDLEIREDGNGGYILFEDI